MSLQSFTGNQKTILSVDFDRASTCMQTCTYCYVNNMERIYPSYLGKTIRNSEKTKTSERRKEFADSLNSEFTKARNSKSKQFDGLARIPVRIYGSGDFIPDHYEVLDQVNFKFYMISKNLTNSNMNLWIDKLLSIDNLTKLRLSFDNQNMGNYKLVEQLYGRDRIGFAFTGIPEDFIKQKESGYKFDVFFNISKKSIDVQKARKNKEQCPADTKLINLQKACTKCSKCWRSSVTRNKGWNNLS